MSDPDLRAEVRLWTAWQLANDQSRMPPRLRRLGDAIRTLRRSHREALFIIAAGWPTTVLMRRYRLNRREAEALRDKALAALASAVERLGSLDPDQAEPVPLEAADG